MSALGHKRTSCTAATHVRFTPKSDRESGHPQTVMSALPPKADVCAALADVCFGPIADIAQVDLTTPKERPPCGWPSPKIIIIESLRSSAVVGRSLPFGHQDISNTNAR